EWSDMLGQCSLRHRFPVCSSGGNSNRKSSFWRLVGTCVFPCPTGTSRSCSKNGVCMHADHVTVWRWVQRYAPELERRLRSRLNLTNDSWGVDETYIRVRGKWVYLYRAVDSTGATVDFLLSAKRDAAAERFLAKALGSATTRRRESSTPTGTPVIRRPSSSSKPRVLWRRTVDIDRYNISITFWNRIIGRSSAGYTQASIFARFGGLGVRSPAMKGSI